MKNWINEEHRVIGKQVFDFISTISIKNKKLDFFDKSYILYECLKNHKDLFLFDLEDLVDDLELKTLEFVICLKAVEETNKIDYLVVLTPDKPIRVYKRDDNGIKKIFDYYKSKKIIEEKTNMTCMENYSKEVQNATIMDFSFLNNLVGFSLEKLNEFHSSNRLIEPINAMRNILLIKHDDLEKTFILYFFSDNLIIYNIHGDIVIYSKSTSILTKEILKEAFEYMKLWEDNKVKCSMCEDILDFKSTKNRIFAGFYCDKCSNTDRFKGLSYLSRL